MTETAEMIDPMTGEIIDQKELAEALREQAREQGVSLLGPGGLLVRSGRALHRMAFRDFAG